MVFLAINVKTPFLTFYWLGKSSIPTYPLRETSRIDPSIVST